MPTSAHIEDIDVSIVNPDRVNNGPGALLPYSEEMVTFGADWVRLATGGYNMFPGFEVRVDLHTAPNEPDPPPVPEPATITLFALGTGSLAARRFQQRRRSTHT
jgi:hypothetical protein